VRFVKGHGTENDFIVLPEIEGDLDEALVRRLCDRHAGIGADGVLAVEHTGSHYFMDYRNADGSIAETCGNGIRVFARYLVAADLVSSGELTIGTRAGDRQVTVPSDGGDITVNMGPVSRLPDAQVTIGASSWQATGWSMGNPHLVVLDAGPIDDLDLTRMPTVSPDESFPTGVNVEVTEPVGSGHVRMRVFERGVGETRSCGTGACAAAVAAMAADGVRSSYVVDVPGGRLVVEWCADDTVAMSGPAVLVAAGDVDPSVIHPSAHIHSRGR
jgi:diaminopimelate epimerase